MKTTSEYLIPGIPGAQLLSTLDECLATHHNNLVHLSVDETGLGHYQITIRHRVAAPRPATPATCPGIIDVDALQGPCMEVR